jgi:hypothetical protein
MIVLAGMSESGILVAALTCFQGTIRVRTTISSKWRNRMHFGLPL